MNCKECGRTLDGIDVGAHRKLIDKSAVTFLCRTCLAKELGWSKDYLDQIIRIHRERGCTLFPPPDGRKEENDETV